jgi:hypothetical protein
MRIAETVNHQIFERTLHCLEFRAVWLFEYQYHITVPRLRRSVDLRTDVYICRLYYGSDAAAHFESCVLATAQNLNMAAA